MPNIAGKVVGFAEALDDDFADHIDQVVRNTQSLAAALLDAGIDVVTGGTDTHIVLVDLRHSHNELTGSEAEQALETAGIIANKTSVPGDSRYPSGASGIRFGTTSLTAQGLEEDDMQAVGDLIVRALNSADNSRDLKAISKEVAYYPAGSPS